MVTFLKVVGIGFIVMGILLLISTFAQFTIASAASTLGGFAMGITGTLLGSLSMAVAMILANTRILYKHIVELKEDKLTALSPEGKVK